MRQRIPRHVDLPSDHPGKPRIPLLEPIAFPKNDPDFESLPQFPAGELSIELANVSPRVADQAAQDGILVFHMVGDTGSDDHNKALEAVAKAMENQIRAVEGGKPAPGFLYHLGDVIYPAGEPRRYRPRFYDPFQYYLREIFAIPGNHDGMNPGHVGKSLDGFMTNFCDTQRSKASPYRMTMTQPYCYFRLDAPFVRIVGLYSNVEGMLDPREGAEQQREWLERQLRDVPEDRFLIVAVHHPPYSLDDVHGGSPDIASALDRAMLSAKRVPDAVVSGHVHMYERFARRLPAELGGGTLPYLVAGAGGASRDKGELYGFNGYEKGRSPARGKRVKSEQDPELDMTFEGGNRDKLSFLRVSADATELRFEAFEVSFDGTWTNQPFDSVAVRRR